MQFDELFAHFTTTFTARLHSHFGQTPYTPPPPPEFPNDNSPFADFLNIYKPSVDEHTILLLALTPPPPPWLFPLDPRRAPS
ncbi:hypothetical protein Halhy_0565 [Haliscomenobacter hydrossis DSM 1100]|uniref:Uncharacterized protein n=1 Tax=Haliscomenobacter hydrossis (strain ATCC 27775 / DSM 1100 / LMG 10767 / O) TaxID=760192 RepID=F4L0G2_HALH1|nr:hypothetical protein Halhy_0565 [Haliscomenobacter hydrossis DSM 1100]